MREKTNQLLQLIAEKSALAQGFFTADAKAIGSEKNAAKICRQQVDAGLLFRVRAGQTTFAYFSTQALANAYLQQRQAAKAATRISFESREAASAQVIHTASTRYSVHPWVDPRAVTVPFCRIGEPGWSMTVGYGPGAG